MANKLIVNKHTNMLIIGKAATDYGRGEVIYAEDPDEVLAKYGKSDLATAFQDAKFLGAPMRWKLLNKMTSLTSYSPP